AGGRGRVERARDGEAHVLQAGDRLSTVRAERRGFGQVAGARKTGNAVAEGRQVAEHTVLVIDRDVGVLAVDKGHLDQPFQRRIPSGPRLGFLDRSDLALCLFEAGGYLRAKERTKVASGEVPP